MKFLDFFWFFLDGDKRRAANKNTTKPQQPEPELDCCAPDLEEMDMFDGDVDEYFA